MERERGMDLQQSIAREVLALLARGCGESRVDKHEQAIQLIGVACNAPEEATSKLLGIIQQGKEAPEKIKTGEVTLGDNKDITANWTAYDTFWVLMDLFQASTSMASQEERTTLYSLADEIIGTQNFEEWLNQKR